MSCCGKGWRQPPAIRYEGFRAAALAALAPQLTGELVREGLAAALAIRDEGFRAAALAALAPQLTGTLVREGLERRGDPR